MFSSATPTRAAQKPAPTDLSHAGARSAPTCQSSTLMRAAYTRTASCSSSRLREACTMASNDVSGATSHALAASSHWPGSFEPLARVFERCASLFGPSTRVDERYVAACGPCATVSGVLAYPHGPDTSAYLTLGSGFELLPSPGEPCVRASASCLLVCGSRACRCRPGAWAYE